MTEPITPLLLKLSESLYSSFRGRLNILRADNGQLIFSLLIQNQQVLLSHKNLSEFKNSIWQVLKYNIGVEIVEEPGPILESFDQSSTIDIVGVIRVISKQKALFHKLKGFLPKDALVPLLIPMANNSNYELLADKESLKLFNGKNSYGYILANSAESEFILDYFMIKLRKKKLIKVLGSLKHERPRI